MADREPWERNDNPEPWTRPDKPAPWLRKNSTKEPQEQNDDSDQPSARTTNSFGDLRNAENNAISGREPSFYTGSGGGQNKTRNSLKSKLKGKGFLKSKGAIITILIILIGIGAFLGTSNSLLAPAISALMTASTQTSYTSYTLRTKFIMKGMLDDSGGGVTTTGWTGKVKYSKIPNYMKNRLAKFDIDVIGSGKNTRLVWKGTEMDASEFLTKFNSDVEFRETFMKAKRGRVATFFDNIADKIYKKLGISRNLFSKYKQTNDIDTDVSNYRNTMEPKFEGSSTNLHTHADAKTETEIRHNPVTGVDEEVDVTPPPTNSETDSTTGSKPDFESAKDGARGMIAGIAGTVGKVGSAACTVLKVGSMVATAAAAQEMYNSINYFMGQLENISKMKTGEGDASAINSLLNFLTTSETTEVEDFDGFRFHFSDLSSDNIPSINESSMSTKTETGAPIEASGLLRMLSDTPTTASDTQNYSLERTIKVIGGAAAFGSGTALTCAGVDLINSIVSLGVTITGGGIVKIVGNFLSRFVVNLIVASTVAQFFSFLVPTLAKVFFVNAFDNAIGIPAGQFLAMGGAAANMREGRSGSGQSPSSREVAISFNHSTNEVLAMEAEQDRYRLSPFDTSNRNTFFGSIAYSLLPTFTSTNITGLSSFLRSTSTSLASLLGRVSADGENSSYLTTFGDCPLLDEIGAVGDLYCNPIISTDMSEEMITLSPDDEAFQNVLMSAGMDSSTPNLTCDDDGECKVNNNSNLAKYISYCDDRDSPFGVIDQNILGNLEKGNVVLNSMPFVGDLLTILNSATIGQNLPWANGTRCGNTRDNENFWETEGKYYQRYIEDQRILEQMGAYEGSKNPVVAYQEEYEAEHPIDNSYIGYLSRISGLTPENTETVLAFITYYDFVNNYDPTIRIAMDGDASEIKDGAEVVAEIKNNIIHFDNNEEVDNPITDEVIIASNHIIYADVRNRSYAI